MLGHTHALSGLAAGAATLPWAPVHGAVAQAAWVAAAGGFAMLPDLDQHSSTISRMWGPLTDLPSRFVGTIARGHRWGTHDAVVAPVVFGALAYAAALNPWTSLLLMALAIGLALRALNFVIPGRAENTVLGNLALSWGGAWLLLDHSPSPQWLPLAVVVGILAHIAGDALTTQGVPVPLVWLVRRCRLTLTPMRTGAPVEKFLLAPALLVAVVAFLWVNTGADDAVQPVLQRVVDQVDPA